MPKSHAPRIIERVPIPIISASVGPHPFKIIFPWNAYSCNMESIKANLGFRSCNLKES